MYYVNKGVHIFCEGLELTLREIMSEVCSESIVNESIKPKKIVNKILAIQKDRGNFKYCLIVRSIGTSKVLQDRLYHREQNCIVIGMDRTDPEFTFDLIKEIGARLNLPLYFIGDLSSEDILEWYKPIVMSFNDENIKNHFIGIHSDFINKYNPQVYTRSIRDGKYPEDMLSYSKAVQALKSDKFLQLSKNSKIKKSIEFIVQEGIRCCLLYTSPSPRDS